MSFSIKNNALLTFLIVLVSVIVFIPFIGNCPLFDWDEVNFAECAREMLISGNYSQVQLNFRPFWEKPPFFIWLQALSMNLFGINEFAARFPNALCSVISLVSLFHIGKKVYSPQFGLMWCLLYTASMLPHFYFKSGIIDPWFNLFIFLSIYQCLQFMSHPGGKLEILSAFLAGFFLGMAVLTKGPAALIISLLTLSIFLIWNRQIKILGTRTFWIFSITTLFVSGSWFLVEYLKGNAHIITGFIDYQIRLFKTEDSGHSGPFVYHFIVLLIGCFPASLIFIASYFNDKELTPYQKQSRRIFMCLFWVVLILFSIVKTKIVHYSSLCYFPLTYIAAFGLVHNFQNFRLATVNKVIYWLVASALSLGFIAIGFTKHLKNFLIQNNLIKDELAVQNLQAEVHWTGFEFIIGFIFFTSSLLIFIALNRKHLKLVLYGLILNIVFIWLSIVILVPKIEMYSQHAAIEFYKWCATKNCYVETHHFKSYAYLFYSNRKPEDYTNPDQIAYIENQLNIMEKEGHSRLSSYPTSNLFWMENGKIDRPAYIVVYKKNEDELIRKTGFIKMYEKNGFSFFVRMPEKPAK